MFHFGRNCPPLMKLDTGTERTARLHHDFTQQQCIQTECLQSNAYLKCALPHQVEWHLGDGSARNFSVGRGRQRIQTSFKHLAWRATRVVWQIHIASSSEQCTERRRVLTSCRQVTRRAPNRRDQTDIGAHCHKKVDARKASNEPFSSCAEPRNKVKRWIRCPPVRSHQHPRRRGNGSH